jgi:methionyl-tRNA formyltransferase
LSTDTARLRLGFAGTPEFAVPALEALERSHRVCAVFTQPDRPAGRGQPLRASPVKRRATERGLPVHQPVSFKSSEALEILRGLELDALIVAAYGLILPAAALEIPRLGCINIHASLLPRWRGAAPIQRAILAGDPVTGVTIMRMEAGLDTGPMMNSRQIDIDARDTAVTLQERLARLGAELVCETLDALMVGPVEEMRQPADGVTYAGKIAKDEASIDWRQDALQIGRQVRAFNPWPVAEAALDGARVRIWDAEVRDAETRAGQAAQAPEAQASEAQARKARVPVPGAVLAAGPEGIDVACGRGSLRIHRLQLAGRKALSAADFVLGRRLADARFT